MWKRLVKAGRSLDVGLHFVADIANSNVNVNVNDSDNNNVNINANVNVNDSIHDYGNGNISINDNVNDNVNVSHRGPSLTAVWGDALLTSPRVLDFYATEESTDHYSPRPEFSRIWKSKCSPTMKIFLWKLCIGKLPVRGLLSRRCSISGDCARCPGVLESIDHALFGCKFATDVWALIRRKWSNLLK